MSFPLPTICAFIVLSIRPLSHPFICPSTYLSVHPSTHYSFIHSFIHFRSFTHSLMHFHVVHSVSHALSLPVISRPSIHPSIYLSIRPPIYSTSIHSVSHSLFLPSYQPSDQELRDISSELVHVGLLIKLRSLQCDMLKPHAKQMTLENTILLDELTAYLSPGRRLSDDEVADIEKSLNQIRQQCGLTGLTPEERVMIVKAMNFSQGHWFKCPNGHVYAIGDCGGAMQESKCPECNARIGGTQHRLLASNQVRLPTSMTSAFIKLLLVIVQSTTIHIKDAWRELAVPTAQRNPFSLERRFPTL